MLATEDIQRQITVAVIVAVEESSFLLAMQRQIGGIDIQNDLFLAVGWRALEPSAYPLRVARL